MVKKIHFSRHPISSSICKKNWVHSKTPSWNCKYEVSKPKFWVHSISPNAWRVGNFHQPLASQHLLPFRPTAPRQAAALSAHFAPPNHVHTRAPWAMPANEQQQLLPEADLRVRGSGEEELRDAGRRAAARASLADGHWHVGHNSHFPLPPGSLQCNAINTGSKTAAAHHPRPQGHWLHSGAVPPPPKLLSGRGNPSRRTPATCPIPSSQREAAARCGQPWRGRARGRRLG